MFQSFTVVERIWGNVMQEAIVVFYKVLHRTKRTETDQKERIDRYLWSIKPRRESG